MKQVLLPILGTIAFILVVGFLMKGNIIAPIGTSPTPAPEKQVKIGSTTIKIEVADTKAKRALGLGKRRFLETGSGMFFVFPQKNTVHNFWMKDMNFAIDIIWISNSKIVKIDKNVEPEPGVADSALKIYSSGQQIDYVLEVNAGFADKNNITIDQTLSGL